MWTFSPESAIFWRRTLILSYLQLIAGLRPYLSLGKGFYVYLGLQSSRRRCHHE